MSSTQPFLPVTLKNVWQVILFFCFFVYLQNASAVTGIGVMNLIAQIVIGEANPNLPQPRMVTTTDITTMVDPVIVGALEDTTVDLGIDRVTEDMTMDLLGTDQVEGTEGTMTDLGAETRDTRTAEETIGTGTVTGERDLAATGIMETETGMKWF